MSCSSCNVSITIRVLSPGDDGDVVQTNAITSTTIASAVDSLQQQVVAALPVVLPQPAAAAPVVPPVVLPAPLSLPAVVQPVQAQELDTAASAGIPELAAPVDEPPTDGASAAPAAVAPPPQIVAAQPVETDTRAIPRVHTARQRGHRAVRAHRALAATVATHPAENFVPPIAPAALATSIGSSEGPTAAPRLERAATGGGASRRSPGPTPWRLPPPDGPYVGSAPTAPGGDVPSDSPAGLLALLVFLVPGFAQWLWARVELRPDAMRLGRPERPG